MDHSLGPVEYVETWTKLGMCAYDPLPLKELEHFFYATGSPLGFTCITLPFIKRAAMYSMRVPTCVDQNGNHCVTYLDLYETLALRLTFFETRETATDGLVATHKVHRKIAWFTEQRKKYFEARGLPVPEYSGFTVGEIISGWTLVRAFRRSQAANNRFDKPRRHQFKVYDIDSDEEESEQKDAFEEAEEEVVSAAQVVDTSLKRADASNCSLTLSQKLKLDASQGSLSPSMLGRFKCKQCKEYVKEGHVCKADLIANMASAQASGQESSVGVNASMAREESSRLHQSFAHADAAKAEASLIAALHSTPLPSATGSPRLKKQGSAMSLRDQMRRQGSSKSMRNDFERDGKSKDVPSPLVRQLSNVTKTTLEIGSEPKAESKLTESALRKHEAAMMKQNKGSSHHVLLHNADCHDADKPPLEDLDAADRLDEDVKSSEDYRAISGRHSRGTPTRGNSAKSLLNTGTLTRGNSSKSLIKHSGSGQAPVDPGGMRGRLQRQGSRKSQMSKTSELTAGSGSKGPSTPPPGSATKQGTQLWSWA
jgi:hypothetical protein